MDKRLILNEIKKHYQIKTDAEFAKKLGVSPQTLSSWKTRNAYDTELIYAKCSDLNPGWLLTGQGPMLKGVQNDSGDDETRLLTDQVMRKDFLNNLVSEAKTEKGMNELQIARDLHLSTEELHDYLFGKRPLYDDIWKRIIEFFRPLSEADYEFAAPEDLLTKVKILEQHVADLRRELDGLYDHIDTLKDFNQMLQKKVAPA